MNESVFLKYLLDFLQLQKFSYSKAVSPDVYYILGSLFNFKIFCIRKNGLSYCIKGREGGREGDLLSRVRGSGARGCIFTSLLH